MDAQESKRKATEATYPRTTAFWARTQNIEENGWQATAAMARFAMTLEEEIKQWVAFASSSRCIYCEQEFKHDPFNQDAADEIKKKHIVECKKHPLSLALQLLKDMADGFEPRHWSERIQATITAIEGRP